MLNEHSRSVLHSMGFAGEEKIPPLPTSIAVDEKTILQRILNKIQKDHLLCLNDCNKRLRAMTLPLGSFPQPILINYISRGRAATSVANRHHFWRQRSHLQRRHKNWVGAELFLTWDASWEGFFTCYARLGALSIFAHRQKISPEDGIYKRLSWFFYPCQNKSRWRDLFHRHRCVHTKLDSRFILVQRPKNL